MTSFLCTDTIACVLSHVLISIFLSQDYNGRGRIDFGELPDYLTPLRLIGEEFLKEQVHEGAGASKSSGNAHARNCPVFAYLARSLPVCFHTHTCIYIYTK